MDVTFFEHHFYYPKPVIQGGSDQTNAESQFWNLQFTSSDPIIDQQPEQYTKPAEPIQQAEKPLLVYSRRPKTVTEIQLEPPTSPQNSLPSPDPPNPGNSTNLTDSDSALLPIDDLNIPIAQRKGKRVCTHHPISNFVSYTHLSPNFRGFTSQVSQLQIPENFQDAIKDPKWREAINAEILALKKNGTWEMVDLPRGKKPVGCKWIFNVKYNADGSLERYKARLVAKGFTQTYGIDYQETFAPVAKLNTIRVLLSLAANLDWPLYQMDIKNAFLNGDLEEEVYMEIPHGMSNESNAHKVCRLKKSLYGLKQSPRAWFERLTLVLKRHSYTQGQSDHTLFINHTPEGKITLLIVYVDDIILTGDNHEEMQRLKKVLAQEFEIKDLGSLKYFLGMEVARSNKGISVSQRKYTLDLLTETGMLGCKPIASPMDISYKLGISKESVVVDKGRYQRLVGKLIYLSHTRPDIGFAVSVASQFMNNPTKEHLHMVYRILRYLKMTPGKGLFFKKNGTKDIQVYSDADWAGSITDRRSTSGYCTYVWGNLVTWRSKKQSVVARSSAEAEFRAMALGICEGMWLKRLLNELKLPESNSIKLYSDSQAAISIAKNPVHHDRTKHVEIDRHFIKEKVEEGTISLAYTPSSQQIADIFTKALPKASFDHFISKLGMINIYS